MGNLSPPKDNDEGRNVETFGDPLIHLQKPSQTANVTVKQPKTAGSKVQQCQKSRLLDSYRDNRWLLTNPLKGSTNGLHLKNKLLLKYDLNWTAHVHVNALVQLRCADNATGDQFAPARTCIDWS